MADFVTKRITQMEVEAIAEKEYNVFFTGLSFWSVSFDSYCGYDGGYADIDENLKQAIDKLFLKLQRKVEKLTGLTLVCEIETAGSSFNQDAYTGSFALDGVYKFTQAGAKFVRWRQRREVKKHAEYTKTRA